MIQPAFWLLQVDLFRLVLQAGWVARIVLLILVGFSVFSWAIIYRKYRSLKLARVQTDKFLEAFRSAQGFPEARPLTRRFPASPLGPVYVAGMKELGSQLDSSNPHGNALTHPDAISVAMQVATETEVSRLEEWMSFLATTGAVTPFIGLFGTVWGVMNAFVGLGEEGAATLRAVSPGIAEALVATAAGLFAAIPAVIAYNHFLHLIKGFITRMDNLALEFVTRAQKRHS